MNAVQIIDGPLIQNHKEYNNISLRWKQCYSIVTTGGTCTNVRLCRVGLLTYSMEQSPS